MSRYFGRNKATNNNEMYENLIEERGNNEILQYTTGHLKYPGPEELNRIRTTERVWRVGDKFWRLAAENYGDPTLWWVIAQFNKKPTEGHLEPGDVIKIPIDLAVVLGALT
tara:strand:- start:6652 stop:6984 length:333 start_codon:yes stop_codon:yes gene_type:complete